REEDSVARVVDDTAEPVRQAEHGGNNELQPNRRFSDGAIAVEECDVAHRDSVRDQPLPRRHVLAIPFDGIDELQWRGRRGRLAGFSALARNRDHVHASAPSIATSFQSLKPSGGLRSTTRRPSAVWRAAVRSAAVRPGSSSSTKTW